MVATKHALKLQQQLKEEREKRAVIDKKEAEELGERIKGMIITTHVKVDPEGHMYGSVSWHDIIELLKKEGLELERRNVVLPTPIKQLGAHAISLKLKEGVKASITLKILAEGQTELPETTTETPSA